ncbi:MAG: hypothetical protein K2N22_04175 [Clostridia bacterium]|nr:hypothetical protein [Clostridia bacterium]
MEFFLFFFDFLEKFQKVGVFKRKKGALTVCPRPFFVIANAVKQSRSKALKMSVRSGLPRRYAPRNDGWDPSATLEMTIKNDSKKKPASQARGLKFQFDL